MGRVIQQWSREHFPNALKDVLANFQEGAEIKGVFDNYKKLVAEFLRESDASKKSALQTQLSEIAERFKNFTGIAIGHNPELKGGFSIHYTKGTDVITSDIVENAIKLHEEYFSNLKKTVATATGAVSNVVHAAEPVKSKVTKGLIPFTAPIVSGAEVITRTIKRGVTAVTNPVRDLWRGVTGKPSLSAESVPNGGAQTSTDSDVVEKTMSNVEQDVEKGKGWFKNLSGAGKAGVVGSVVFGAVAAVGLGYWALRGRGSSQDRYDNAAQPTFTPSQYRLMDQTLNMPGVGRSTG